MACTETHVIPAEPPAACFNVFYNNDELTGGSTVCDAVFPVPRCGPLQADPAGASLEALFLGPTAEERARGYRSFFSERTAGLLIRVRLTDGTAYIDLRDLRRDLAGATSSCGSAEFFSQIQRTVGELPGVDHFIFAIEGDPALFYDWMEMECDRRNNSCDPAPFTPL